MRLSRWGRILGAPCNSRIARPLGSDRPMSQTPAPHADDTPLVAERREKLAAIRRQGIYFAMVTLALGAWLSTISFRLLLAERRPPRVSCWVKLTGVQLMRVLLLSAPPATQ